jgi:hypothetical protein
VAAGCDDLQMHDTPALEKEAIIDAVTFGG